MKYHIERKRRVFDFSGYNNNKKKFSGRVKGFFSFLDFPQEVYKRNGDKMTFVILLIANT